MKVDPMLLLMQELYVLNQVMHQYLRGGSDSIHSCLAIHNSMLKGLNDAEYH